MLSFLVHHTKSHAKSACLIIGDVNFNHLLKVVSISLFSKKVSAPFVISK